MRSNAPGGENRIGSDSKEMDDPQIPLNVILDLAGHASADSLKPYTVPSAHDRQKAVERLAYGSEQGKL